MKIKGKWKGNEYKLIGLIGVGNFGKVYMVRDIDGNVKAMKISKDTLSITNEYNAMIALKDLEFVPIVYELDDWEYNKDIFHYIVMEYIFGINLKKLMGSALESRNIFKIGLILVNMFKRIDILGYKYTDIKLENIILDSKGRIYFIDFGGLIEKEMPTKEYTPIYNINSWNVGFNYNHQMEVMFSITMIMISLIGNTEYNPLVYSLEQIKAKIQTFPLRKDQIQFLCNALDGKYKTFSQYEKVLSNRISYNKKNNSLNKIDYVLIASIVSFVFVIIMSVRYFLLI